MALSWNSGPKNQYAFVICTDANYASHAGTCLFSLLLTTTRRDFDIHVIANRLSADQCLPFSRLASLFGVNLIISDASAFVDEIKGMNVESLRFKLPHLTESAFLRIFYNRIIDASYERIVYLDCDIVIRQDACQLLSQDLGGFMLAATPDLVTNSRQDSGSSGEVGFPYFNSGVLLIDDKKWRSCDIDKKLASILSAVDPKTIKYLDQDILNAYFRESGYSVMSPAFNYQYMATLDAVLTPQEIPFKAACVVHYAGEIKPWHEWASESYAHWYRIYRRASPWGEDFQPEKPRTKRHIMVGYQALSRQSRYEEASAYAAEWIRILQQEKGQDR